MTMDQGDSQVPQKVAELSKKGYQHVQNNRFAEAIEAYEEAHKRAEKLDDKIKAICALNLGAALVARGKNNEDKIDKNDLEKGLAVLRSHYVESEACQTLAADTYFNIAFAYENLKESRDALKFYDKARKKAFKFGNVDIEMECRQKAVQICITERDFQGASENYKALAVIYSRRDDFLGQAECLCEAATILMKGNMKDKAVAAANDSFNVLNDLTVEGHKSILTAKILNDLGLVFIQLVKFNEGMQCFERAFERFQQSQMENPQLEAVLLQNLGASYNFEGDYQRSIHFHEKAIEKYGKIRYRGGQGQCFMNLAFALSQLGVSEIRNAEIAFQHALQASKDTGDHHMRWQTHEGLGAVTCNQGNYSAAKQHFQEALKFVGHNNQASNRIVKKLEMMIAMEMKGGQAVVAKHMVAPANKMLNHMEMTTTMPTIQEGMIVPAPAEPLMSQFTVTEETTRKTVGQQKRVLPLRRHDSIGMYHVQKVSRGLATPLSTRASMEYMSPRFHRNSSMGLEEPASGGESSEEGSDVTEETSTQDKTEEKEESSEEESEASETSNRVSEEKIRQVYAPSTSKSPLGRRPLTMEQTADGSLSQYQKMLREKEEEEEEDTVEEETESEEDDDDDDDDSESEEENDDSDDDGNDTRYLYSTIQKTTVTKTPEKPYTSQDRSQTEPKQIAEDFSHQTLPKDVAMQPISESAPSPGIPQSPRQQNEQMDDTNPYATIGSIETFPHGTISDPDKEDKDVPYASLKQPRDDSTERSIDSLPRGQRDRLLAKEHQKAREKRKSSESSEEPKEGKSKTCVVM